MLAAVRAHAAGWAQLKPVKDCWLLAYSGWNDAVGASAAHSGAEHAAMCASTTCIQPEHCTIVFQVGPYPWTAKP